MFKSFGMCAGTLGLLVASGCTINVGPEPAPEQPEEFYGKSGSSGAVSGDYGGYAGKSGSSGAVSGAWGKSGASTSGWFSSGSSSGSCDCDDKPHHAHRGHDRSPPPHRHHRHHRQGGGHGSQHGSSGWPATSGVAGWSGWSGSSGSFPIPGDSTFINETGWYAKESNPWGIQGAAYAYSDGSSVSSPAGGVGYAYDASRGAYCISGTTVVDSTYMAWGGGIAFDLAGVEDDPTGEQRQGYDWQANGVAGFRIGYSFKGPQVVRIGFADFDPASTGFVAPFVVGQGDGIYRIANAKVPSTWIEVPNAGKGVTGPIHSVQIMVVGADHGSDGPYELCINAFEPISELPFLLMK